MRNLAGLRLGLAMAACVMVSGCYESTVAVIDKGDAAAIAGDYTCKVETGDDEAFAMAITDQGNGSYRFAAPDVTGTVTLRKLDGNRHLLQIAEDGKPGTFYYAYGEPDGEGFRAFAPRRDNSKIPVAARRKYAVRFVDALGHDDPSSTTLEGSAQTIAGFLADPAAHDLAPWFNCKAK